eukprot:TRINITY_DN11524_c0_g1_i1.p1 TRINITY_DN11524_c0_g1~~TRINITY_DN11524_c0_g1_i1.p1  ORF type:complete len:825 (+),score=377.38 TRINITY_DN11524_c0_g1_i1:53-2527(+)
MAPSSKGKVASDHVKAFNVAVAEYKAKACEKALAEVDKILAVLVKISDSSVFSPSNSDAFSLLLNCQYLLSYLDHKSNTVWAVVGLLTTLCTQDTAITKLLLVRLELLPICAKLLHSLPSTTQARTLKLLQLLKLVVDGVVITRREAYLTSLLSDLASFLSDSTPDLSALSLFILCCLCRGNYISTKLLLATLPPPSITALFSTPNTTPSDQLVAEILCYYMTRVQLSPNPPNPAKVNSYLPKLLDVFCSSYVSDDISLMSLLTSFLTSLSSDTEYRSILAQQDCLPSLQQLLVMADFSDGFTLTTSSHLFTFLTTLTTTFHTDNVQLFDIVLKVVLARLDVRPYNKVTSALILVKTMVQNMDFTSMPDAVARNLKFQVDQLLPSLMTTFLDSKSGTKLSSRSKLEQATSVELDREAMASCMECLQLLQVMANVPLKGWRQAVGETVKANKMVMGYRGYIDMLKELVDRAKLTTEFLTLANILGDVDNNWGKVVTELLGDKDRIKMVAEILRQDNMEGTFMKKALAILNKTDSPEMMFGSVKEEEAVGGEVEDQAVIPEQLARIDCLMEGITDAMGKMDVEQVVGEVMQLATVRRGQEKQQLAYMMEALAAADSRVASQNTALVEREEQVRTLERVVTELVIRLGASKEELGDIRSQHGDLSREADSTRDKLGRELGEAREKLEELQGEKVVLIEKYGRYKDQVVRLTEDLKQYKENQEQLELKLKQEMRGREELAVTLNKREDRLKKKEKQLDEELSAREKAEKENEDLRKQCASLETLSKRQEQALNKKEKLLQESQAEVTEMRRVQDAIFNLSKTRGSAAC